MRPSPSSRTAAAMVFSSPPASRASPSLRTARPAFQSPAAPSAPEEPLIAPDAPADPEDPEAPDMLSAGSPQPASSRAAAASAARDRIGFVRSTFITSLPLQAPAGAFGLVCPPEHDLCTQKTPPAGRCGQGRRSFGKAAFLQQRADQAQHIVQQG